MVHGKKADTIIERVERALLGVRIGQTVRKVKALVEKTENLRIKVYQRLPSNGPEVEEFVVYMQLAQHTEVTSRNVNKPSFNDFGGKNANNRDIKGSGKVSLASEIMSRWVINYSDCLLSDPELSVLKKGLNFVVTHHRVPVVEIVTATESACRSF